MGTGYVRNDTANNIADGNVINASDLDGEFDAIQSAFNASTGHSHDGTSGEGPQIDTAGIADDSVTPAKLDSTLNYTVNGLTATTITFGGVTITSTANELNILDGVTATAGEINKLDGFTGTVDDLNYAKDLRATGVTTAEFDKLDGLTATATELNYNDITTLGTVQASKTVTADGSGNINFNSGDMTNVDINSGTIDGTTIGSSSPNTGAFTTLSASSTFSLGGTAVTSNAAELNILDGATLNTAELNLLDGVTATTAEINYIDGVTSNIQTQLDAKGNVSTLSDLGVTATAAELNKLDNVTSSATEFNVLDGDTTATSTTLVDADRLVVNDDGTMVQVAMTDVQTYVNANLDADILKADVADTITVPMRGTVTADNDLSFDMNVTNNFKCTPTGNGTLTFTNITSGQSGNIWLDNSGGHTISAAASTYISSADLTTISAAGVYFLSYYSDGTNVMVSATPAVTSAGA